MRGERMQIIFSETQHFLLSPLLLHLREKLVFVVSDFKGQNYGKG